MQTPLLDMTGLSDPQVEFKYDYNDLGSADSGAHGDTLPVYFQDSSSQVSIPRVKANRSTSPSMPRGSLG